MGNNTTYKDSPLGKIPIYWDLIELGEISNITSSKRIMLAEYVASGIPFYRSKEVIEKINGKEVKSEIHIPETTFRIIKNRFGSPEANQILMTAVGSLGQAYLIKESDLPFYFKDGNLLWLKNIDVKKVDINFLLAYFKSEYFKKEIDITTYGSSQKALTIENLNIFTIPIPPLPEQRAIASCLSIIDETITKIDQLIAQKELRKKWLMQQLLSGKKRLKGFGGEWKEVKIGDVFEEIKETNDGGDSHSIMTISSKLGLISQQDKFDRVIAGDSLKKYTQLKIGDFAYNKGNSKTYPMGCVYQLEEYQSALVPFVYICFKPSDKISSLFYKQWFNAHGLDRQLQRIITSGARGDGLLNVNSDDFFKLKIPLPPKDEQTAIAQLLQSADKEIQLLKAKAEKLKEEKKGMMQQLLTGKKRLK